MTSRLTTRSDTPTVLKTDRITLRVTQSEKPARLKLSGNERSKHLSTRTSLRAAKPAGVTMDYQQGFTSGPSM